MSQWLIRGMLPSKTMTSHFFCPCPNRADFKRRSCFAQSKPPLTPFAFITMATVTSHEVNINLNSIECNPRLHFHWWRQHFITELWCALPRFEGKTFFKKRRANNGLALHSSENGIRTISRLQADRQAERLTNSEENTSLKSRVLHAAIPTDTLTMGPPQKINTSTTTRWTAEIGAKRWQSSFDKLHNLHSEWLGEDKVNEAKWKILKANMFFLWVFIQY